MCRTLFPPYGTTRLRPGTFLSTQAISALAQNTAIVPAVRHRIE